MVCRQKTRENPCFVGELVTEELKVSLGLREDGSVVHIGELDMVLDRGLDCRCICSECGDRLVARLGDVRQHHFAHYTEQSCTGGDESALHLFAKEIFKSETKFRVPKAEIRFGNEHKTIWPALYVPYREAVLERRLGDIVPDISLLRDNKPPMLVEILVTHEVDRVKAAKLEAVGLPCIEIDLSKTYHSLGLGGFDRAGIKQLLIHGDGVEKKWICIPDLGTHKDELEEKERKRKEELEERYRLMDKAARLAQEQARVEQEQAQVEQLQARLKQKEENRLKQEQEYLEWRRRARERRLAFATAAQRKEAELAHHPMWKLNSEILGIELDNIPYYLNIQLAGEFIFACHRAVWQSALFISWVFNNADVDRSLSISIKVLVEELKQKHPELLEHELILALRSTADDESVANAVCHYFGLLEEYGFVRDKGDAANSRGRVFECLRPRVVALPPEFNNSRYRPRENGILDVETGQIINYCAG